LPPNGAPPPVGNTKRTLPNSLKFLATSGELNASSMNQSPMPAFHPPSGFSGPVLLV
jgi:hypothetical protein